MFSTCVQRFRFMNTSSFSSRAKVWHVMTNLFHTHQTIQDPRNSANGKGYGSYDIRGILIDFGCLPTRAVLCSFGKMQMMSSQLSYSSWWEQEYGSPPFAYQVFRDTEITHQDLKRVCEWDQKHRQLVVCVCVCVCVSLCANNVCKLIVKTMVYILAYTKEGSIKKSERTSSTCHHQCLVTFSSNRKVHNPMIKQTWNQKRDMSSYS